MSLTIPQFMTQIESRLGCKAHFSSVMERREIYRAGSRYVNYVPGIVRSEIVLTFERPHTYNNYLSISFEQKDLRLVMENEGIREWFITEYLENLKYADQEFSFQRGNIPAYVTQLQTLVTLDAMKETYEVD